MVKAKKNNNGVSGTTPSSVIAPADSSSKSKKIIIAVVILLTLIGLGIAASTVLNRNKQNVQNGKTVTLNATQAEQELKNNKILNSSQKNSAFMAVASQYLIEKKYDAAIQVAKSHEKDPQTKESAYCGIEITAYQALKNTAELKSAASECLKILKLKQPTDPYEKGVLLYSESLMYKYTNDTANEKLTKKAFLELVESNKLTTSEEFGPIYTKLKAEK